MTIPDLSGPSPRRLPTPLSKLWPRPKLPTPFFLKKRMKVRKIVKKNE